MPSHQSLVHVRSILVCQIVLVLLWQQALAQTDMSIRDDHRPFSGVKVTDVSGLAALIRENTTVPQEQLWLAYTWVSGNVAFDVRQDARCGESRSVPDRIIERRQATGLGFASLFKAICDTLRIPCERVDGYAKTHDYRPGEMFITRNHTWNAVQLEESWYLVDVCWGSGQVEKKYTPWGHALKTIGCPAIKTRAQFVNRFEPRFFLADPLMMAIHHLPVLPMWQLLPCAVPLSAFTSKQYDVQLTLEQIAGAACFNMPDSIRKTIGKGSAERALAEAKAGLMVNHYNNVLLAEAYNLRAHEVLGQLVFYPEQKDLLDAAISVLDSAEEQYTRFKKSIKMHYDQQKNWNKSFNKRLVKENDRLVKTDRKLIEKNLKYASRNKQENQKLKIENAKIASENNQLDLENIEEIGQNRKAPTPEQQHAISENIQTIKNNKKQIDWNKKEKQDLRRNNKEEKELFINQNIQAIIKQHGRNNQIIRQNIALKMENNHWLDTVMMLNKDSIAQLKEKENSLRQVNEEEAMAYIRQNIALIKEKFRENKSLIRHNKKAIKANKRLGQEGLDNNQLFVRQNQDFIDDNNAFIEGNLLVIAQNRQDAELIQRENLALKAEIRLLTKENKLEKVRFKHASRMAKKRYAARMTTNDTRIEACGVQIKHVKQMKKQ